MKDRQTGDRRGHFSVIASQGSCSQCVHRGLWFLSIFINKIHCMRPSCEVDARHARISLKSSSGLRAITVSHSLSVERALCKNEIQPFTPENKCPGQLVLLLPYVSPKSQTNSTQTVDRILAAAFYWSNPLQLVS